MFQSEETNWLNGYEIKTHVYLFYKRSASDLEIQTEKEGGAKRHYTQMEIKGNLE